jgi:P4 family phage/plasmid primase-like protien
MTPEGFAVTFFRNSAATTKHEEICGLTALATRIEAVTAATKDKLPWLKLARFGELLSDKGSLRHDANILAITGIEADLDDGTIGFDEAADILTLAGIKALLYTSPSHRLGTAGNELGDERLRVLCPTSRELPPSQREHLMGRINGLLRGKVSAESWARSQGYYFGRVGNNPAHRVQVFQGVPIDLADELDSVWTGKPQTAARKGNGADGTYSGRIDEAALRQGILTGDNYHVACLRLVGAWAQRGMPMLEAKRELETLFDGVFPPDRGQRWKARRDDIARTVQWVYGKEAGKLDALAKDAPELPEDWEARHPTPETKRLPKPDDVDDSGGGDGGGGGDPPLPEDDPGPLDDEPTSPEAGANEPDADASPMFSEDYLALSFAMQWAHLLRYVALLKRWWRWMGDVWNQDTTLETENRVRALCREAANTCAEDELAYKLVSEKTIAAVERLTRTDRRYAATIEQWDADIWLLNTPAGVFDPHTGRVRAHRKRDYMTKITRVAPQQGACPTFMKFLADIFRRPVESDDPTADATEPDWEIIKFVRRYFGSALTGCMKDQKLLFCYGTGNNGKTTLLQTIFRVMGSYAVHAPIETFLESPSDRHLTEMARLRGARLVIASEIPLGRHWNESRIKDITGGEPVTANFMRRDHTTSIPQCKLAFGGNHKPGLRSNDIATKRRWQMLPFTTTIPRARVNDKLLEDLEKKDPQILQWLIEGCNDWMSNGLQTPERVVAATNAYLIDADAVSRWLVDCCELAGKGECTTTQALFESWKTWVSRATNRPPATGACSVSHSKSVGSTTWGNTATTRSA